MRNLLAPIAIIYGLILRIRHWLYDSALFPSYKPTKFSICIGNLEFGGTGKTPHSIYILEYCIKNGMKPALVSRGYGRRTKGLRIVELHSSSEDVGDEPLMVKNQIPEIPVLVSENRKKAITYLEQHHKELDILVLDDAFQHRAIRPHFSILLTDGKKPYWTNKLFPWGSLRDIVESEKRADLVITTRNTVPSEPYFRNNIQVIESEQVLGKPICKSKKKLELEPKRWLVFCGIANSGQFFESVKQVTDLPFESITFRDHHRYSESELKDLVRTSNDSGSVLLTTEKDWMRICENQLWLEHSVYVIPMEIQLKGEALLWNEIQARMRKV